MGDTAPRRLSLVQISGISILVSETPVGRAESADFLWPTNRIRWPFLEGMTGSDQSLPSSDPEFELVFCIMFLCSLAGCVVLTQKFSSSGLLAQSNTIVKA